MILLLLSLNAHSADLDFCQARSQILAKIAYCEENDFFVKAADACLQKLEQEILKEKKLLEVTFQKNAKASKTAQDGKILNTKSDLTATELSFQNLLTTANVAKQNITLYKTSLAYSGNPTEAMLATNGLRAHLQKVWCYSDNLSALNNRLERLETKIGEIKKSREETLSLLKSSEAKISRLEGGAATISSGNETETKVPTNSAPRQSQISEKSPKP